MQGTLTGKHCHMYNILHALDHLYINLYHVCTNAEMDNYLSFTKQLLQNNVRGKKQIQ